MVGFYSGKNLLGRISGILVWGKELYLFVMHIIGVFEIRYSHENEPTYWPLLHQTFSARLRHDQKFQKLTMELTPAQELT